MSDAIDCRVAWKSCSRALEFKESIHSVINCLCFRFLAGICTQQSTNTSASVLQVTPAFASFHWLLHTQQSTNFLHQGYFLNIRVTLFLASPFVFVFDARHFSPFRIFPNPPPNKAECGLEAICRETRWPVWRS